MICINGGIFNFFSRLSDYTSGPSEKVERIRASLIMFFIYN